MYHSFIHSCAELLDNCKFAEFWQAYRRIGVIAPSEASTDSPPFPSSFLTSVSSSSKSVTKIRVSILKQFALSFKSASASTVLPALDMSKDELEAFLRDCKEAKEIVSSVSSDKVEFVSTGDNTKKVQVNKEGIQFDTIASLMMKASQ